MQRLEFLQWANVFSSSDLSEKLRFKNNLKLSCHKLI
jgi:hypothetical protein